MGELNINETNTVEINDKKNRLKEVLKNKILWLMIAIITIIILYITVFRSQISIVDIQLDKNQVTPGESITVSVNLENKGILSGKHDINLIVNGAEKIQDTVSIKGKDINIYEYTLNINEPGKYEMKIEDLSKSFKVLKPAKFEIGFFQEPVFAIVGENLSIQIQVNNIGEVEGECEVFLKIDDIEKEVKKVVVPGETIRTVIFHAKFDKRKDYLIDVNGAQVTIPAYEISRPANRKYITRNMIGGSGKLYFNNGSDNDCIVYLFDADEEEKPLVAMYVRSNSKATLTGIKDGVYLCKYILGSDFEAGQQSFLNEYSIGSFGDKLKFKTTQTTYTYWTLEIGSDQETEDLDDFDGFTS